MVWGGRQVLIRLPLKLVQMVLTALVVPLVIVQRLLGGKSKSEAEEPDVDLLAAAAAKRTPGRVAAGLAHLSRWAQVDLDGVPWEDARRICERALGIRPEVAARVDMTDLVQILDATGDGGRERVRLMGLVMLLLHRQAQERGDNELATAAQERASVLIGIGMSPQRRIEAATTVDESIAPAAGE